MAAIVTATVTRFVSFVDVRMWTVFDPKNCSVLFFGIEKKTGVWSMLRIKRRSRCGPSRMGRISDMKSLTSAATSSGARCNSCVPMRYTSECAATNRRQASRFAKKVFSLNSGDRVDAFTVRSTTSTLIPCSRCSKTCRSRASLRGPSCPTGPVWAAFFFFRIIAKRGSSMPASRCCHFTRSECATWSRSAAARRDTPSSSIIRLAEARRATLRRAV